MRAYLIDNDRAKLMAMANDGKTVAEIKSALKNVLPKAVDDYIAGTPDLAKQLGKKGAPAESPKK